jgi:hypothetical protein
MIGHYWGDPDVDWKGINDAAEYIGEGLRKWGRVDVWQTKEKFGQVRVYCSLGLNSWHQLTHPGHAFNRWPRWLWLSLNFSGYPLLRLLNCAVEPYHIWLYRRYYRKAVERWPHLREEILCAADYPKLLVFLRKDEERAMKENGKP